jgi:hypothetical protein
VGFFGAWTQLDDAASTGVATWDGSAWASLPAADDAPNGEVIRIVDRSTSSTTEVYVVGSFTHVGGVEVGGLAIWDGTSFSAHPEGGFNGAVHDVAFVDHGSGVQMYVAGEFTSPVSYLARYDTTFGLWLPVGSGVSGPVHRIVAEGSDLYVFGDFFIAGGTVVGNAAYYDGSAWNRFLDSNNNSGVNGPIHDVEWFDSGSGAELFVTGEFSASFGSATPISAACVIKWTGTTWASTFGVQQASAYSDSVAGRALEVYDPDGPGGIAAELALAGDFETAVMGMTSITSKGVVLFDGSSVSALGSGLSASPAALGVTGRSLTVYSDGLYCLPRLVVGGRFTSAGGNSDVRNIGAWNGSSWEPLWGIPMLQPQFGKAVRALAGVASTGEPELWIGGRFGGISTEPSWNLARLTPAEWCPGDANRDRLVNNTDLNQVLAAIGNTGPDLPEDFDCDGDVDFADFNQVLSYFNTSCP